MLIRFKVGKDKYEIDEDDLTGGEAFLLKREYGLNDFGDLTYKDPEVLLGLKAVAIRRKHEDVSEEDARTRAEAVKDREIFEDLTRQFEKIIKDAEAQKQVDPPLPAESASTAGAASGGSETTRARSGSRRTPKS